MEGVSGLFLLLSFIIQISVLNANCKISETVPTSTHNLCFEQK